MVKKITALRKLRPELKRVRAMRTPELVSLIARETGLNEGEILFVTYELRDSITFSAQRGQAVKVEGLGLFAPKMRSDGSLTVTFRPDRAFLGHLNRDKVITPIINRANIGKSADELLALWNQLHPEDPVEE